VTTRAPNNIVEGARGPSFRQAKLFVCIGRTGNVTSAARKLGISQPAAAQSLAVFQRICGFRVIVRMAKGTAVTPRGRELLERLQRVVDRLEEGFRDFGVSDPAETVWSLSQTHIEVLEATRSTGTLDHGAQALGISLRSAQRAIATLERMVANQLVERRDRRVALTNAGDMLAQRVGLLAREMNWSIRDLRLAEGRAATTLIVGVAPDPGTAALNAIVRDHVFGAGKGCLDIRESGQADLIVRLSVGELDIVIGHIDDGVRADLAWEELGRSSYRIAARQGHPLAGRGDVTIAQLVEQHWVLGARGSQRRAASDALFAGDLQPTCALVTSAAPMMAHVLADSDMLGMMTDVEIASRPQPIVVICSPARPMGVRIGWLRRMDWRPTAAQAELVERVKSHLFQP
jgi:LysR family transcriptional regulator, regulator for genes of the gallate degradation pathway